jgi:hypothetical protein
MRNCQQVQPVYLSGMEAVTVSNPAGEPRVLPAFPSWLDLPPGYLLQDWIRWQKGIIVARGLRENPACLEIAVERLRTKGRGLFAADAEWLDLMVARNWPRIFRALEAPDEEGQRLRSSMPFTGEPFVTRTELEGIHERAFAG